MPPHEPSSFERKKWRSEHALELRRLRVERSAQDRELALKERDQRLRLKELAIRKREVRISRWTNPLVIAILGAALAGLINAGLNWLNSGYQYDLEDRKSKAILALERTKSEGARILEMLKAPNPDRAAENLSFLVDAGLVSDPDLLPAIKKFLQNRKKGTGPFISQGGAPGTLAYTGECTERRRVVCYMDNNGQASNCMTVPC